MVDRAIDYRGAYMMFHTRLDVPHTNHLHLYPPSVVQVYPQKADNSLEGFLLGTFGQIKSPTKEKRVGNFLKLLIHILLIE